MKRAGAAKGASQALAVGSFSVEQLAALVDMPPERIEQAAAAGLFRHARQIDGAWRIPPADVRAILFPGSVPEQLYTLADFAALLGLSYSCIHKATKRAVDPLRTVTVFSEVRIPASEFWRVVRPRQSAA